MSVFSVRLRVFVISVNTEKLRGHFHLHTVTYCSWADLSNMLDITMKCSLLYQYRSSSICSVRTSLLLLFVNSNMASVSLSIHVQQTHQPVSVWRMDDCHFVVFVQKTEMFQVLVFKWRRDSQQSDLILLSFLLLLCHLPSAASLWRTDDFVSLIYWIILTVSFLDIQSDLFWSLRGNDSYL